MPGAFLAKSWASFHPVQVIVAPEHFQERQTEQTQPALAAGHWGYFVLLSPQLPRWPLLLDGPS